MTHRSICYPERCFCHPPQDECSCDGEGMCLVCKRKEELVEEGKKPLGLFDAKPCPLCGEHAIIWIDPKLCEKYKCGEEHKHCFYSIGCVDAGSCGLEINGWLNKDDMVKHWNRRVK